MKKTKHVEQTLKEISSMLMKEEVDFSNTGLIHGKMGLVIFFFHYARFTKEIIFEDYALMLIEQIQKRIFQNHINNYSDGLAGIGTGIEYLSKNNFIEVNTNEVLEDFDKLIFSATIFGEHSDAGLFTGLSGIGRYLLFRIAGKDANDDHIGTLNNKMLLIHLTDIFERIYPFLTEPAAFEDVFIFLKEMNKTNIFPAKTKQLIKILSSNKQSSKKGNIMRAHRRNIELLFQDKLNEFLTGFQGNIKSDFEPGLYGGLAGIGLYLLSILDKRHETWIKLL